MSWSPTDSPSFSPSPSDSQSFSLGYCPSGGITGWYPDYDPNSAYNVLYNSTFPLVPLHVDFQLSGRTAFFDRFVYLSYNYTYFHLLSPNGVHDCLNQPNFDSLPYVNSFTIGEFGEQCERTCYIWLNLNLGCPADAPSGNYYLTIPHVGKVTFNLTVCLQQGEHDYDTSCIDTPACGKEDAWSDDDHDHKDKNIGAIVGGTVGGVVGFFVIVMIILAVQGKV